MTKEKFQIDHPRDTVIQVSGFRSLNPFDIILRPGINMLVGPNGSGKTNFLDFLDFLVNVVRDDVSEAVSKIGGIGKLFSLESKKRKILNASIQSIATQIDNGYQSKNEIKSKSFFYFNYNIKIVFDIKSSQIYIAKENIYVSSLFKEEEINDNRSKMNSILGKISISRTKNSENPAITISKSLKNKSEENPFTKNSQFLFSILSSDAGKNYLDIDKDIKSNESIFSKRQNSAIFSSILKILRMGQKFNIDPNIARLPDDLSDRPFIKANGAGLSATLHSMQLAKKDKNEKNKFLYSRINKDSFDNVLNYAKIVMSELRGIEIVKDHYFGTYNGYISINQENNEKLPIKISFQSISDGTIKWLTLVSLLVSETRIFSIDEPENFLHPTMQIFLIDLIREYYDDKINDFIILSTHSETMINRCDPSELILFDYITSTKCRRIPDPQLVKEEINKTGFGLGYYYASNAV